MKLSTKSSVRSVYFCAAMLFLLTVGFLSMQLVGFTQPSVGILVKPFDLSWSFVDPNGIPLNPIWGQKILHPESPADPQFCDNFPYIFNIPGNPSSGISGVGSGNPSCTNQTISYERPTGFNEVVCSFGGQQGKLKGHVNWPFPATFTGPITWEGKSDVGTDDDYNIDLAPLDRAILVPASQALHTEFDSDETIDHFHTPWWESFHSAVDAGSGNRINGTDAIEIGLPGLDCEHSCSVELHPVWALAMHDPDPAKRGAADDVWGIFARNWGDEGYCSSQNHPLQVNSITLKLPWRNGASGVVAKPQSNCQAPAGPNTQWCTNSNQVTWSFNPIRNDGVLVTFTLPSPEAGARVNGELHLQWSIPDPNLASPGPIAAVVVQPKPQGDAENNVQGAVAQMTPPQRNAFRAKLRKQPSFDDLTPRSTPGTTAISPPLSAKPPEVRAANYPDKVAKDRLKRDALCSAFGDKIPGFPDACKQ